MNFNRFKSSLRENALVPVMLLVAVHLCYAMTWQAGFVTDFTGLQERLDGAPFSGFLTCFGFPALHQVTNFFLFVFYKTFGTDPLPWYLIHTTLHVLNGWLGYLLAKKILPADGPGGGISWPALMAALLFLLLPYNAEAVVWKVCFNFLFCTACLFGALLFFVKYLEKGETRAWVVSCLLYLVSLFTFELALAMPLMALAVLFFWENKNHRLSTGRTRALSFAPYFLLAGLYFVLNKMLLGGWVGHYGEAVHLNVDPRHIASNLLKYFTKNLLFWREWAHPTKESLMAVVERPDTAVAFLGLSVGALAGLVLFWKKLGRTARSAGLAGLLFFMALAPVSNLYVVWLLHGENDRYGYFASLFFFIGVVALTGVFGKKTRWLLCAGLLVVCVFNLMKINGYWEKSAAIVRSLLDGFEWQGRSEIYVLAFPENYRGIPMFKDFSRQDLALKSALKYLANKPSEAKFYQVAQFNMNHPADGFTHTTAPDKKAILEFREWGSWWWRHGLGAGPYSTDQYDFNTAAKGSEITIKKAAPDAVFLYSDGGAWRQVEW